MNAEEKSYWDRQYKYVNDNIGNIVEIYSGRFVMSRCNLQMNAS